METAVRPADRPPALATEARPRPEIRGKFLYVAGERYYVRGVTYGAFRPGNGEDDFPAAPVVEADFDAMLEAGINTVRTYAVPPEWVLDAAAARGLRVMVGLPWEQHVAFLDDRERARSIEHRLRAAVRACRGHPALLCYAIGSEIPASIVRWHGPRRVERFLARLYRAVKQEDPQGLVSYVNFPSTDYLELPFLDLVTFNVYLEDRRRLEAYLARLQALAGDRPLLMGEVGLDSRRNGRHRQARVLRGQIEAAAAAGCAGAFVFAWTDEWHPGGADVGDTDFGLTTRTRRPKPALAAVRAAFAQLPPRPAADWPRISVVVCTHNGQATLPECLRGLQKLDYPDYEVIVVNDGSTDGTAATLSEYPYRIITTDHRGLAAARNTGLAAATGEIVAYLDDDAHPEPDWLTRFALTFRGTDHAGVGGPDIAPAGGGAVAECAANVTAGRPYLPLPDGRAERIAGCNMAFRKQRLEEIGGFDPRFQMAGDDADICWRLRQRGLRLGFNPAAVVWHHRRDSLRAYLRRQRGYGRAQALLERKWPQRYAAAGRHTVASLPLMPQWYLLLAALAVVSVVGVTWPPLLLALPALGACLAPLAGQAVGAAARARFATAPRSRREALRRRVVTAMLYVVAPLARLAGRGGYALTRWRRRPRLRRHDRVLVPRPWLLRRWSERWRPAAEWTARVEAALLSDGELVRRGGAADRWDLDLRAGLLGAARLRLVVEEHGAGRQLIRHRVWPRCSATAVVLVAALATPTVAAAAAGAGATALVLAGVCAALALRVAAECASAMSALVRAVKAEAP